MDADRDVVTESGLITNRSMDIAAALLFLIVSGLVIFDSVRLGFGWEDGVGPSAGYFPFYMSMILAAASLANLSRALLQKRDASDAFLSRPAFLRVLAVLVPLIAYIAAIYYVGIYVASAIFIALFMRFVGRYGFWYGLIVGCGTALALFLTFEKWFLVPLPKGPIEAWFGF